MFFLYRKIVNNEISEELNDNLLTVDINSIDSSTDIKIVWKITRDVLNMVTEETLKHGHRQMTEKNLQVMEKRRSNNQGKEL